MTNAVDILLVGGDANGHLVCMNRLHATTYIDTIGTLGVVTYSRIQWTHPTTGKLYWIAVEDAALPPTDAQVIAEIDAAKFNPAWDLN